MPPGNEGIFDLGIVDVLGFPIRDTVRTVLRRGTGDRKILFSGNLQFPPRHAFPLPAFPQEANLVCEISPARWRMRTTGFFTLTDQEPITRNLTVLRQPGSGSPSSSRSLRCPWSWRRCAGCSSSRPRSA
jgi:hypothetical protein